MNIEALKAIELGIPLWQMAFCVALISLFMLFGKDKHCISVSLVFFLYWGFFHNRIMLHKLFGSSPFFMTSYIVCAIILFFLILISFFIKE